MILISFNALVHYTKLFFFLSKLTLMDWERLQLAGSLQTEQDYAWSFG